MDIRDAVEDDAEVMAALADSPVDVMRNLVHDRTVRVATDGDEIVGFVSFDARRETVHVTQLEGEAGPCGRLLDEPVGFARREGMAVELLVPDSQDGLRDVVEDGGFVRDGVGPTFAGTPTVRYRFDSSG